jgi:quercetin dioxygenase-like cupin family protein
MGETAVPIRRVITGHSAANKAKVIQDGIATNMRSPRPGQYTTLMWCTDGAPAEMPVGETVEDMGARTLGTYPPVNGTRFMIADYPPNNEPTMHRTETVDYIVVLSGKIDMELDDGEITTLSAGDVMVQRGTNHAWINRYDEVCRMVFVLVDAKPLGFTEHLRPRGV